jgi:hypothetical protein
MAGKPPIGVTDDKDRNGHTFETPSGSNMKSNIDTFGEVIYSYSRAQAIEDGVLADLSQFEVIRSHWKLQMCCTYTVWCIIQEAVAKYGKDTQGILHDISTMAKLRIGRDAGETLHFSCIIGTKTLELKLHCGPGDTALPVLTLMLPSED